MSRRKNVPPPNQGRLFDAGPARGSGYSRPKHFAKEPTRDEAAAVIRGVLAAALDEGFVNGELGRVLWQGETLCPRAVRFFDALFDLAGERDRLGALKLLRRYGLDVFQALAVTTFPELYGEPGDVGIVPEVAPERVGRRRWEAFAALLRDVQRSA